MNGEQLTAKMGDQEESKDRKVRTATTLPTKTIMGFKFIKPHHLCAAPTQIRHLLSHDIVTFRRALYLLFVQSFRTFEST